MNKALRIPDYLGHILQAIERIERVINTSILDADKIVEIHDAIFGSLIT
ncbi:MULTISPECIES: hypothetical protein [unclassified Undibacterium]|nr:MULTISPECIES: hypothetical protein [unclassified Undibacterium]MEB0140347.1 hypothetical protein [Undibacterium sp. CCC2.1]MEB0173408.1 hypothetical protein [Undibacterium sp. CCC1.1]MEB0176805.1 hypothetical protein [Undibacterium sp. CCC3.4]MEB0216538.1 hypothetical protein [Undibacterium sp. 5I2]WPX43375.1 hypothetical protein RHM61_18660 [Undibacterium sp. CCC3.4]